MSILYRTWWVLAIFFITSHLSSAKIKIKIGTVAPEGSPWLDFWHKGVNAIETKSKGAVKIITYTSIPESDAVEKLNNGILDIVVVTAEGTFLLIPEFMVVSIPLLITKDEEIDRIRNVLFPIFQKIAEKKGYHLLAWFDQGFVYLLSTYKVSESSHIQRLKIGVWSKDPLIKTFWKNLGAKVFYIQDPSIIIEKLKNEEINGTYCSPLVCTIMQWFTVTKYILDMRIRYEPGFIITTNKFWRTLPSEIRKIISLELTKRVPAVINLTRWYHASSLKGMMDNRIIFVKPSYSLLKKVQKIATEEYTKSPSFIPENIIQMILKEKGQGAQGIKF